MSVARVYSDQTLFDEPTRASMNVSSSPAALVISKLIPADAGIRTTRDYSKNPVNPTKGSLQKKKMHIFGTVPKRGWRGLPKPKL